MVKITERPSIEKRWDVFVFGKYKEMTLDEAIALKKKLFPEVEGILCETVTIDRSRFIWAMRFLYGNGYEVVKIEKDKII